MVKICKNCGQRLHENTGICIECECTEFDLVEGDINDYEINEKVITRREFGANGNIFLGVIGAFIFSLAGGLLYFFLYNWGIFAGISGLAIFYLSGLGYKKFSRCNNSLSTAGLITSIVLMVVIILGAHYVAFSYEIYQGYYFDYIDKNLTFIQSLTIAPQIIAEPEVTPNFINDLLYSYFFGILATAGDVIRILRLK